MKSGKEWDDTVHSMSKIPSQFPLATHDGENLVNNSCSPPRSIADASARIPFASSLVETTFGPDRKYRFS